MKNINIFENWFETKCRTKCIKNASKHDGADWEQKYVIMYVKKLLPNIKQQSYEELNNVICELTHKRAIGMVCLHLVSSESALWISHSMLAGCLGLTERTLRFACAAQ